MGAQHRAAALAARIQMVEAQVDQAILDALDDPNMSRRDIARLVRMVHHRRKRHGRTRRQLGQLIAFWRGPRPPGLR